MVATTEDRQRVRELHSIVRIAKRIGVRGLNPAQLTALPPLYRFASSLLARLETSDHDPKTVAELRPLLFHAHGLLHREEQPSSLAQRMRRFWLFVWSDCPRTIRAEWKLIGATLGLIYGLAALAYLLVQQDLSMAYSLFNPQAVDNEIEQLRALAPGEAFRGNFTFGLGESPGAAGYVMGNNMRVAAIFFAAGVVPPLYFVLVSVNGLMLGTYTGVAAHWDQAANMSSILWCHGVLELQALVLAGSAGLILLRAWIAPGPWSRTHAMRLESARAWRVFVPSLPMLFVAGLIEGFVSPHANLTVRLVVIAASLALIVGWFGFGGRVRERIS